LGIPFGNGVPGMNDFPKALLAYSQAEQKAFSPAENGYADNAVRKRILVEIRSE